MAKGKITSMGWLYIQRGGKHKLQYCPFALDESDGSHCRCGDWCPLFGEPREEEREVDMDNSQLGLYNPAVTHVVTGRTELCLCKKTLVFDEFVDERA